MLSKYTLRFKNESKQQGSICVYQIHPDQKNNKNIYSLAWLSKECHSGTKVSFEWDIDYRMPWSETVHFIEGGYFKASHAKEAVQNSSHDTACTPDPTYWIAFGDFEEGKIINVNNISQAIEVVFVPNVYELSLTFTKNNEWEINGINGETYSGGGLHDLNRCKKTDADADIEKKSYEKSNHLCGYGLVRNPEPFDDFVHIGKLPFCKITKLSIWAGEIIDGLEVTYSNGKTYKHGCTDGAYQALEFGEDSIVGIKGHYSVAGTHPYNAISNMTVTTHFGKRFGSFGFVATGAEGKFNIGKENCHIAILFGIAHTPKEWSAQVINNIGGYYAQF